MHSRPKQLRSLLKEHPNVEFRVTKAMISTTGSPNPSELVSAGPRLKDTSATKIIHCLRLSRDIAANTIDEVAASFDKKWTNAEMVT